MDLTVQRFSGLADVYDRHRPRPPRAMASLLCRLAGTAHPELVVDLGCGTGLSARYWAGTARRIIGIDASPDMLRKAHAVTRNPRVTYREGLSCRTGLPPRCARIVTCGQSLHWMDPGPTFREVRRILKPGGVFAAYDYDWPPMTASWEADQAYAQCMTKVDTLSQGQSWKPKAWPKSAHLSRMRASRCFRHVREIVVHHVETGNAERLVGVLLSQGGVSDLLKRGIPERRLGIDRFRTICQRTLGGRPRPWHWSAWIRLGIV